jgi:cell division protein FtsB
MSDIDRKRMIPLHIADQAVAACDAEIQKLKEENARLKAEVERLRKHRNTLIELLDKAIEDLNAAKEGKQP